MPSENLKRWRKEQYQKNNNAELDFAKEFISLSPSQLNIPHNPELDVLLVSDEEFTTKQDEDIEVVAPKRRKLNSKPYEIKFVVPTGKPLQNSRRRRKIPIPHLSHELKAQLAALNGYSAETPTSSCSKNSSSPVNKAVEIGDTNNEESDILIEKIATPRLPSPSGDSKPETDKALQDTTEDEILKSDSDSSLSLLEVNIAYEKEDKILNGSLPKPDKNNKVPESTTPILLNLHPASKPPTPEPEKPETEKKSPTPPQPAVTTKLITQPTEPSIDYLISSDESDKEIESSTPVISRKGKQPANKAKKAIIKSSKNIPDNPTKLAEDCHKTAGKRSNLDLYVIPQMRAGYSAAEPPNRTNLTGIPDNSDETMQNSERSLNSMGQKKVRPKLPPNSSVIHIGSTVGNSFSLGASHDNLLPSPFSLLTNLMVPSEPSTLQRSSSCPCRGAAHASQRSAYSRQRSCSPCCRIQSSTASGSTITVADRVRQRHVANARINYFEGRAAREAVRETRGLRPTIIVQDDDDDDDDGVLIVGGSGTNNRSMQEMSDLEYARRLQAQFDEENMRTSQPNSPPRTRRTNTPTSDVIDISGMTDNAERLVNALGGSQAVTQILSSPHTAPSQRPSRRELDEMESRLDILRQLSLSSDYLDESIISEVLGVASSPSSTRQSSSSTRRGSRSQNAASSSSSSVTASRRSRSSSNRAGDTVNLGARTATHEGGRTGFFGRVMDYLGMSDTDMDYDALLALSERIGDVKQSGISKDQIKHLPTRVYQPDRNNTTGVSTDCHICMCEFERGQKLRTLPCFHEYHIKCIDKWLAINATCPVCRGRIA